MNNPTPTMTSNRPYLIRAIHEWIEDNGMTPHLLVDAGAPGVQVPPQAIKDGQVVLNIAARAVARLELGNEAVSFMARFSGVSHPVMAPITAVMAIYAQETGQGMMLPREEAPAADEAAADNGDDAPKPPQLKRPQLRIVK